MSISRRHSYDGNLHSGIQSRRCSVLIDDLEGGSKSARVSCAHELSPTNARGEPITDNTQVETEVMDDPNHYYARRWADDDDEDEEDDVPVIDYNTSPLLQLPPPTITQKVTPRDMMTPQGRRTMCDMAGRETVAHTPRASLPSGRASTSSSSSSPKPVDSRTSGFLNLQECLACEDPTAKKEMLKKIPCRHWENGLCSKGKMCRFYHDPKLAGRSKRPSVKSMARLLSNDPNKAPLCFHYIAGICSRGKKCRFSHDLAFAASVCMEAEGYVQNMQYGQHQYGQHQYGQHQYGQYANQGVYANPGQYYNPMMPSMEYPQAFGTPSYNPPMANQTETRPTPRQSTFRHEHDVSTFNPPAPTQRAPAVRPMQLPTLPNTPNGMPNANLPLHNFQMPMPTMSGMQTPMNPILEGPIGTPGVNMFPTPISTPFPQVPNRVSTSSQQTSLGFPNNRLPSMNPQMHNLLNVNVNNNNNNGILNNNNKGIIPDPQEIVYVDTRTGKVFHGSQNDPRNNSPLPIINTPPVC